MRALRGNLIDALMFLGIWYVAGTAMCSTGCGDLPPSPCDICKAQKLACDVKPGKSANGVPTWTYSCLRPDPVAETPQGEEPPPEVSE